MFGHNPVKALRNEMISEYRKAKDSMPAGPEYEAFNSECQELVNRMSTSEELSDDLIRDVENFISEAKAISSQQPKQSVWSAIASELTAEKQPPPVLVREYGSTKDYEEDAVRMAKNGYEPSIQSSSSKMGLGRVAVGGLALGPAGLILGGLAKKQRITVTWTRKGVVTG